MQLYALCTVSDLTEVCYVGIAARQRGEEISWLELIASFSPVQRCLPGRSAHAQLVNERRGHGVIIRPPWSWSTWPTDTQTDGRTDTQTWRTDRRGDDDGEISNNDRSLAGWTQARHLNAVSNKPTSATWPSSGYMYGVRYIITRLRESLAEYNGVSRVRPPHLCTTYLGTTLCDDDSVQSRLLIALTTWQSDYDCRSSSSSSSSSSLLLLLQQRTCL